MRRRLNTLLPLFFFTVAILMGCSTIRSGWDKAMMSLNRSVAITTKPDPNRPHYDHLYVLGDSLSDIGVLLGSVNQIWEEMRRNVSFTRVLLFPTRLYFKSPFYRNCSFSNGPLAVEYLAGKLNLSLQPAWRYYLTDTQEEDLAEEALRAQQNKSKDFLINGKAHYKSEMLSQYGTNYATAGAMIAQGNSLPYMVYLNQFNLTKQLNALVRQHPSFKKRDLFVIIIGGNDLIYITDIKKSGDQKTNLILADIHSLQENIIYLIKKGARHIIVGNVPDISLTPRYIDKDYKRKLAKCFVQLFNKELETMVDFLIMKYPTVDIKLFDLNKIFVDYLASPKNQQNITRPCIKDVFSSFNSVFNLNTFLVGGFLANYIGTCNQKNIDNYPFFDSIHPTAALHEQVGNALYKLVKD